LLIPNSGSYVFLQIRGGGLSKVANIKDIIKLLNEDDIKFLTKEKFIFRSHLDTNNFQERESLILSYDEESREYSIRFRFDLMSQGGVLLSELDKNDLPDPITNFLNACHKVATSIYLNSGDILCISNRHCVHYRTEILSGLDSERFLIRIHSS
jgi:hypothetical protein